MWPLLLALTSLMPVTYCNSTAMRDLPAPANVHIDSYNMKHILRWDPVEVSEERLPVTYRVECVLSNRNISMCENINETQCDLTDKIQPFWRGAYRVRAEVRERTSAWTKTGHFQANIDTKIGPVKSLVVESHENTVKVDFSPPFSPILKNVRYTAYYWKEGAEEKTEAPLRAPTHFVLEDLEELTVYCVQVKASTDFIEGQASDPKCVKTMSRDYSEKQLAVAVVCVISVCGIGLAAGFVVYRNRAVLKRLLYPPFRMPNHIQEFLENVSELSHEESIHPSDKEEHYNDISLLELSFYLEDDQLCSDPDLGSTEKT
ncbi:interferon gamma receptor 2-like [Bufo gargarizans]|uniref:interferon gamma receptor 2-like n=1 Tax=Bufo gargarizans TaxID=30331 RepID=UPI001CF4F331|nr:interferon gamma receptor 2-like [Bufo gargarizans]